MYFTRDWNFKIFGFDFVVRMTSAETARAINDALEMSTSEDENIVHESILMLKNIINLSTRHPSQDIYVAGLIVRIQTMLEFWD